MGLTLITGRAGAGAAERAQVEVAAAARAGRDSVLLVPGFADVRRAREGLASRTSVGVEVTTFERWLEAQWRCWGDGRQIVSPVLRTSLMRLACRDAAPPLDRIATSAGLADVVAAIAARSAGLSRTTGGGSVTVPLVEILEHYESTIRGLGLVEPGEAARHLADAHAVRNMTVVWSGFTDLSTTQLGLLRALSRLNDVVVALTWAQGSAATEALDSTVAVLSDLAETTISLQRPKTTTELGEVERRLYDPRTPLRPVGEVVLSEAEGPEAEAVLVAQAASRAIRDGFEPERIAVVFRDLARRRGLIETALRAADVPFLVEFQVDFASTPLGSALLALASVARGAGGRVELLHYLQGPFADASAADVEQLDVGWRRRRENEPSRLLSGAARLTPRIARIIQLMKTVSRQRADSDSLVKWQELTATMLSLASEGGARHEGDTRLDVAVHGRLAETVAQIGASGAAVTGDALLAGLASLAVSSGSAERSGAIQVTDAHRIRSRSFDVVILGGLTASEFSSEKREPLVATLLGALGLSQGMDERLAERMLYYLVVTRARRRLELVRQVTDASGNTLRPSVFWDETRDLYRTSAQAAAGEDGRLQISHTLAIHELASAAPEMSRGRAKARADAERGRIRPPAVVRGALTRPERLWPANGEFSVTEIEQYLGCPYQWFYGRVIRPVEVDRSFDARSKGSYVHALMAGFYARLRTRGFGRVSAENLGEALALFDAFVAELPSDAAWQARGLREELAAASARTWARSAVEQDAGMLEGYLPIAHEWEFGIEAGVPFEMGGVPLRGKVDRVDAGADGVVITDYKSSASVHGYGSFVTRRLLQAAVYAQAAGRGFGLVPVASMYRSLRTGALRGFWNSDVAPPDACVHAADSLGVEQMDDLLRVTGARIAEAAEGIRSGHIEPAPAERSVCGYCGARSFCEAVTA